MTQGPNVTTTGGSGGGVTTGIVLPPPPVPRKRRPVLAAILIFFVFIAGMLAGSGLTIAVAVHRLRYAILHPETVPHRITDALRKRLKLTEEQAVRVEAMIAERQHHLQAIRREVQPQVQSELDGLREDVAAILDPEQKAQWERLYGEVIHTWMPATTAVETRP